MNGCSTDWSGGKTTHGVEEFPTAYLCRMDPVRRFLELVQRPFPRPEQPRTRVVMAVGTGIFVAVFLLFFRPFGLHEVDASKMAVVAGFGAVTTACMLVMYFVVPRLFPSWYREEAWIVGREIMDVLMTIVLIGVGNTFYSAWAFSMPITVQDLLTYQVITAAVGVFPSTFIVLLQASRYQALFAAGARTVEAELRAPAGHAPMERVVITDDEGKQQVDVPIDDLLLLTAADNYVQVTIRHALRPTAMLLRTSLRSIEERHPLPASLFRCHRSYIVNLDAVEHVTGNAQGYVLHLPHDIRVPVARSRTTAIRDRLRRRSVP